MIQPTCQQALFSWNLAGTPRQIPRWNFDEYIPKLEGLKKIKIFYLCYTSCVDLNLKKNIVLHSVKGKSEDTSGILLDSNLIQIRSANNRDHVLSLSFLIDRLCPALLHTDT